MIEQDTVRLLRECDSGVKMGIDSIEEVLNEVKSEKLKNTLERCKAEHESLESEIRCALERYGDDGKNPSPIVKGMSWIKTNMKLALNDSDKTISGLMTDGCNMGVKSLSKYLNEYKAADESSKNITKKLIGLEENLAKDMRAYL